MMGFGPEKTSPFSLISALLFALTASVLAGCEMQSINSYSNDDVLFGIDDSSISAGNPRFAAARTVMSARCVSCHRAFQSYTEAQFVSIGYVVAGDAGASQLYSKLKGSGVGGEENMPPSGTLSTGELSDIRDWINAIVP